MPIRKIPYCFETKPSVAVKIIATKLSLLNYKCVFKIGLQLKSIRLAKCEKKYPKIENMRFVLKPFAHYSLMP